MTRLPTLRELFALLAGAATVFGFAPFGAAIVPIATLALLALMAQDAATPRSAAWLGFAFGFGLFGAGVSWVYVALNTFGGMPLPLAAVATAGFCAYLALFPAAAGWLAARFTSPRSWQRALAGAAAWTAMEWLRSVLFTGFGWLSQGYSQPPGSALAGYAPIGGTFAVTLAVALAAAFLALAIDAFARDARRRAVAWLVAIAAIGLEGFVLGQIVWTSPAGAPVAVSLVQGNVAQDVKFDPDFRQRTFDLYAELVRGSRGRLVVLP